MRLLQLQLGEGAHEPQRHRALLRRERQAAALLRHVEERLGERGDRQARLLAGRHELLRQVGGTGALGNGYKYGLTRTRLRFNYHYTRGNLNCSVDLL